MDKYRLKSVILTLAAIFIVAAICITSCTNGGSKTGDTSVNQRDTMTFLMPDTSKIPHDEFGAMVRYGRELIVNTAKYIGPDGTEGHYLGNKMNCGNCHMDAGTRPFGLNYFSSHGRYPQFRGRENAILTLAERVNNCIERPHLGRALPLDNKEMKAMVSYMKWVAESVPVGQHVRGDEGIELKLPSRAADPAKGAILFTNHCSSCHGADGAGQWTADSSTYVYPPLWGPKSFQSGSSMHRILKAAQFIKANMPDKKAFWNKPFLTDEEAIDVSAFINDDSLHFRPSKNKGDTTVDYPNYNVKPIDYDVAPFNDPFTARQHKLGPFLPIIEYHKAHNLSVAY